MTNLYDLSDVCKCGHSEQIHSMLGCHGQRVEMRRQVRCGCMVFIPQNPGRAEDFRRKNQHRTGV